MFRAYDSNDFYRAVISSADLLHLIAHADRTKMKVGAAKGHVKAANLAKGVQARGGRLPDVVVSTACEFESQEWKVALKEAGARLLIAAKGEVRPANLTAFDMAFYSALLGQVRRGHTSLERVRSAFELADKHYRTIHAKGTPFAKFHLTEL